MADAQASGACYGNIVWVQVPSPAFLIESIRNARKCRNWQTSKTKDLVVDTPCGFKSHLPHKKPETFCFRFFCLSKAFSSLFRFFLPVVIQPCFSGTDCACSVRHTQLHHKLRHHLQG